MSSLPIAYQVALFLLITTLLGVRLAFKLPTIKQNQKNNSNGSITGKNLMVLLGSGGHTGEMIRMLSNVEDISKVNHIDWIMSSEDTKSIVQLQKFVESSNIENYHIITLFRTRRVGEGLISSIFSSIKSLFYTLNMLSLVSNKPDILILNGPGTSVPITLTIFLFNLIEYTSTKVVYIESLARVVDLSLSGKFCYLFVDRFLVQWPQLKHKYPKTEYYGILV